MELFTWRPTRLSESIKSISRYLFTGAIKFSNRSWRGKWCPHFLSKTPFLKIRTFSLLYQIVANGPELSQYVYTQTCKYFFLSTHTNPRMKIHIFWDFSPCRLVNGYRCFGDKCLHIQCKANQLQGQALTLRLKQSKRKLGCFDPEVRDTIVFRNVYNYLPVNTA
jgi:hypothetical protein